MTTPIQNFTIDVPDVNHMRTLFIETLADISRSELRRAMAHERVCNPHLPAEQAYKNSIELFLFTHHQKINYYGFWSSRVTESNIEEITGNQKVLDYLMNVAARMSVALAHVPPVFEVMGGLIWSSVDSQNKDCKNSSLPMQTRALLSHDANAADKILSHNKWYLVFAAMLYFPETLPFDVWHMTDALINQEQPAV